MVQFKATITTIAGLPVSPEVRIRHAEKMLREVCGLILTIEQREPAKAVEAVGRMPWDVEAAGPLEGLQSVTADGTTNGSD